MSLTSRPPVAIITGAARGIGAAVAQSLASRGFRLALCDIEPAGLQRVGKEIGAITPVLLLELDVRDSEAVTQSFAQVAAEFGGIDVLVNGAGVAYFGGVASGSEDEWTRTLDINAGGYFRTAKAAIPFLQASDRAHLINLSSVWGLDGSPSMAAYAASKHAVEGLTKSIRKEIGKSASGKNAVKVSSIVLDKVDTDFREHMTAHVQFDASACSKMLAAQDVADTVQFILNSSSRCLPSTITLDAWLWS